MTTMRKLNMTFSMDMTDETFMNNILVWRKGTNYGMLGGEVMVVVAWGRGMGGVGWSEEDGHVNTMFKYDKA